MEIVWASSRDFGFQWTRALFSMAESVRQAWSRLAVGDPPSRPWPAAWVCPMKASLAADFNGHKKRRQRRRELLPLPAFLMKGLHGMVREAIPFRTAFLPILRARRMAGFPCAKPFDPSIRPPKSRRGQNGAPCRRGSAVSHLRVKAADGFLRRSALTMSDGRTTTGESAGYCKNPEKTAVNRGRNR